MKHFTKQPGEGYWDLSCFPWGGSFRRLTAEKTFPIIEVVSTYTDGTPRDVITFLEGKKAGFTL